MKHNGGGTNMKPEKEQEQEHEEEEEDEEMEELLAAPRTQGAT